jgi:ferredoxin
MARRHNGGKTHGSTNGLFRQPLTNQSPYVSRCLVCNCNQTMPLDGKSLGQSLGLDADITIQHELCRRQIGVFEAALGAAAAAADTLTIACTQEAPLFAELADGSSHAEVPISFVNIRETAGWSAQARAATPKMAALLAAAQLPAPEPALGVSYESQGTTLIVGAAADALAWGERLCAQLDVCVLITEGRADLPLERRFPVVSGRLIGLTGWLGAFEAAWSAANPIDLDACTRCGACLSACPEAAIDFSYQIDLDKCTGHRACVAACGEARAIDFARAPAQRHEKFDLVFDLREQSAFAVQQPPQGYVHAGSDPFRQAVAALELAQMVGSFEKPKYFRYNAKTCAHSRSRQIGCTKCIDICSTAAISADGDHVKVEPHLCMGCGACATVCPSGAMTYAYPQAPELGTRIKTLLKTYGSAGGSGATLLIHDAAGRKLIEQAGRAARGKQPGRGLPARVIPLEVHHTASLGLDLWLSALAYGAAQVAVLTTGAEAPQYAAALAAQIGIGNAVLDGLGYAGAGLIRLDTASAAALEAALWAGPPGLKIPKTATYNVSPEKRATLEFAIEHMARHAPKPAGMIPLPAGALYGAVEVNRDTCTLCLSCVGACPASALVDNPETPQLRFIERNCVQCGLCASTCPEDAITLVPRLNLGEAAKKPLVLNEAQPFHCVRCAKPFGTRQMVDGMVARLTGHSMFASGTALRRLQMCADCRVVDMMENKHEASIFDVKR